MSEYQYYEFRAIDRPLTDRQMRELRAISTRAAISRTSFSNHYEYGDLKANPRDLLVRYFDASLYLANWLFLELAFRYPKGSVGFVDIMGIDRGLIAAAAEGASRVAAAPSPRRVERWIAALDTDEHVALLSRVARGDGSVGAELMRRSRPRTPRQLSGPLRTAGALRAHAASITEARRQTARQREARERARSEREQQVARDRYLTGLAKRERQAWQRVDALVGTKRPADYAAAVELLVDLREVSGRTGRNAVFGRCIADIREVHAKKPSLLARLRKVGL